MAQASFGVLTGRNRGNWIRLRTLILLRWVAIVGQLVAITVAQSYYNLQLELGLCYLAVGVSVMGNLIAIFIFPENKRLSETQNTSMVLFDLLQLAFLLFLTGGLHNPFALLLLAPVTISATILSERSTIAIGGIAILLVTVLSQAYFPLRTEQDFILFMPTVFVFGNWAALVIAIVFIGVYSWRVTSEMHSMADALNATQEALSREQTLTDLGGVVAAAAHELGTPLATIKLASGELMELLDDQPDLREDAALIREQADRCRQILRDMGRAGKSDTHLRRAPLITVIAEAAEPHAERGKKVIYNHATNGEQPLIQRKPEIIHGLRNLVQNAVDFAKSQVWVESLWTADEISIRIMDDGPGFPTHLLGRIGDPFMSRRKTRVERPGYEGMGLGLFIAKTLLERTGAELRFANGQDPLDAPLNGTERVGAIVEVVWPRAAIDAHRDGEAVMPNERITA